MSFHVGQKVVCIGEGWKHPDLAPRHCLPRKDQVYTISNIDRRYERLWLQFHEIQNSPEFVTFCSTAFRPLAEKKLPAELTALLDIKNHKLLPEHHQPKRQKVSHDLCGND